MNSTLTDFMSACQSRVENLITKYLNTKNTAPILEEAITYGVLNGGKRIRPLLVYATGIALEVSYEDTDAPACAIELIHSYSLIHDDLPAMDNADLRRGKPSCHKKYGEAMAILAGDTLQTLAFHIIATHPSALSPDQRIKMISVLCEASGIKGMAGGQALDITIMNKDIALVDLLHLYNLKTGALLRASIKLGAIAANLADHNLLRSLETYAESLGLAFQIQDDILDLESSTEILGKPQRIDSYNNKTTYPMLCGIEKSKEKVNALIESALKAAEVLGDRGAILKEVANYLLKRQF